MSRDRRIEGHAMQDRSMRGSGMRGAVTMLGVFAVLYGLATATRRLFLSGVMPISEEQTPQPMWLLDVAFLVRAVENIAILGLAAMAIIALAQWIRKAGFRRPGA
jgi:hypothetical protein